MRFRLLNVAGLVALMVLSSACGRTSGTVHEARERASARPQRETRPSNDDRFWERFGPEGPVALVVAENTIVAVGAIGETFEYERDPGDIRWSAKLDLRGVNARPAMSASTVLVTGGDEAVAVDRSAGAVRWRVPVAGAGAIAYPGPDAGTFLVTSGRSKLLALEEHSGAVRWSTDFDSSFSFGMAASDGAVLVLDGSTTAARLRMLDGSSGALRWSRTLPPSDSVPVATIGAFVVATGTSAGGAGAVLLLDAATGEPRWETQLPAGVGPRGRPVADGESVAVLDAHGDLHLLNLRDGHERWSRQVAESGEGTLRLTPSAVLLNDAAGTLEIDRASGEERSADPAFLGMLVDQAVLEDTIVDLVSVDGYGTVVLRPA